MKNVNYVEREKFLTIARKLELNIEEQSSFYKVTSAVEGKAVYVPKTEKVAQVDISGFVMPEMEGIRAHHKSPTNRVLQELDFSQPEGVVLKAFAKTCKNGLMKEGGVIGKKNSRKLVATATFEQVEEAAAAACTAADEE